MFDGTLLQLLQISMRSLWGRLGTLGAGETSIRVDGAGLAKLSSTSTEILMHVHSSTSTSMGGGDEIQFHEII